MRAQSALLIAFALLGCSKKTATATECEQAASNMNARLAANAVLDLQAAARSTGHEMSAEEAKRMVAETHAAFDRQAPNETWGIVKANAQAAMNEACRRQPEIRVKCVIQASTVEELVDTCHMKAVPGIRGGTLLSWPE